MNPDTVRWAVGEVRGTLREEGARALAGRAARVLRKRLAAQPEAGFGPIVGRAGAWRGSVVVIAERLVSPQWHDRAEQIASACRALDVSCVVACTDDPWSVLSAMQTAAVVFVCRVPPNDLLARVVTEAQRLRVPLVYDVASPVFRVDRAITGPASVVGAGATAGWRLWEPPQPPATSVSAVRHRGALRICRNATTATAELAAEVARIVPGEVSVLPNGVDDDMRRIATGIDAARAAGLIAREGGRTVIGYGAGGRVDDRQADLDLAVIEPALVALLTAHEHLDVRLVSSAYVPRALQAFGDRVQCAVAESLGDHLWELAQCDVLVAPLQYGVPVGQRGTWGTLDAGVLGMPVVTSPTGVEVAVDEGVTGLVAVTTEDWVQAVESLLADPVRRSAMGKAAVSWAARHESDGPAASALIDILDALRVSVV